MKLLTIATHSEGYLDLLKQSAGKLGYDLEILGWQQKWQGFAWKLALYMKALSNLPPDEPVICVDGYDVLVIAPAAEMAEKFYAAGNAIVFSGQRYFPNNKRLQKMADQVMSNNLVNTINQNSTTCSDYSRPCTGLFAGYADALSRLFTNLLILEQDKGIKDDQTLLNIYYLEHKEALQLDKTCTMFQNLWRTQGFLYGNFSSLSKYSEVELYYDQRLKAKRLKNKEFATSPCFIHGPFNLNLDKLIKELDLEAPSLRNAKNWHYLRYSITHHATRAIKLYLNLN